MRYNPDIHHRRSVRLKSYDYAQNGAYFVTICVQDRRCLFGEIMNEGMTLNGAGKMIKSVLDEMPNHYDGIRLGKYTIMQNHIHLIIEIVGAGPRACPENRQSPECAGQPQGVAPTRLSLNDIVHRIKTLTTKRYADGVKQENWSSFNKRLWQRNYYERIIRDEAEYAHIAEYIINNPANWDKDDLREE
ncbi:MAG: transposase [Fusobacteriaceae bacterium]|jgi:REP element-mobilizing transposase RayT|nr:transposase [Fusobacteriaceae bacterium]